MLGLKLRPEFEGKFLKGTAIELTNAKNTGATQRSATEFLAITYPTTDVLQAVEAVGPDKGRPVVLLGERGLGKSHLLAVLYHALTSSGATKAWLGEWAHRLGRSELNKPIFRDSMHVISESLHRQSYKFLWELLFERHPDGAYFKGKWEGLGEKKPDVPGTALLTEMFQKTPTAVLLDEFQTWYDGLTQTKQYPWRSWAFNFIQILSEIAEKHPESLVLVVSVRDGGTEAYQQVHRVDPIRVDFKGPNARRDRQRLLLHRLFENRMQVADGDIATALKAHVGEFLRLRQIPPADHERTMSEFKEAWPFAPHLLGILEDQVLVATQAQETRDLIRILADLFKRHGDKQPILTAADFRLDDEGSGINALLDSVANDHHRTLREKAQQNLRTVSEAVQNPAVTVPHLSEIVGALWLRSLAIGHNAGAEPIDLQIDVTRDRAIDANQFQAELNAIVENSFNIHQDEGAPGQGRLVFREEENPQAKLFANARNDRLFEDQADVQQLIREVRYVIGGEGNVPKAVRVVALPPSWESDPWKPLDGTEHPNAWDERTPILVLPESPEKLAAALGTWLKNHLQKNRNAVRFVLPADVSTPLFSDRDVIVLARVVFLADRWKGQSPEYKKLQTKYERDLREILKVRFTRFAVLDTWNFQEPTKCTFHVETHKAQGTHIPEAVDKHIRDNLFIPETFDAFVRAAAEASKSLGDVMEELREPRPNGSPCIAWLGETELKERIFQTCARGDIAINLRGTKHLQAAPGESYDSAWHRMRGDIPGGKHMYETYLQVPQPLSHAGGLVTSQASPTSIGGATPSTPTSPPPLATGGAPPGSTIFATPALKSYASPAPTSGLNLLAQVKDSWNISTGTQVRDVTLRTLSLTGAQLEKLLKNLPDGATYELTLNKEEK
jgi:hypothetical protein